MTARILIIEDERALREAIRYALTVDAYEAICCGTGREGLEEIGRDKVDLVLLDVGLPDCNGFDLFHQIRALGPVPTIFLTARAEEIDRVSGLEQGADDYVTKPFSPRELMARVRTVLRRAQGIPESQPTADPHQDPGDLSTPFTVDDDRQSIRFYGNELKLTRYEYGLLRQLIRRPGVVFSREQLLEQVWEEPEVACDRSVDSHVKSIRAKLDQIKSDVGAIVTRHGVGYALRADW